MLLRYGGSISHSLTVQVKSWEPNHEDADGVTVSESSLTIQEGSTDTYTVVLNTQPAGNVTVTIGGVDGTDVSVDKTTLTFTAQTVTVTAEEDDDSQDETDVTLSHAVASTTDTLYNAATASDVGVTVTDNDVASVTVSFEQATYTVAEGDSVTVTVKLSADPERTVMIPISKDNQGGATSADYSRVSENVTFNSGDMEKTFSFTADAGFNEEITSDPYPSSASIVSKDDNVTLVSNHLDNGLAINSSVVGDSGGDTNQLLAQKFTTGSRPGGYTLASVFFR